MPFNGAGTFTLVTGNPVITGTVISSAVHNNTNNDIAAGLTNTVTRDGQSAPMANLPMGGFKHTGAADAVANGQYVTYGQVFSGGGSLFALKSDLADTTDALKNSGMVGFSPTLNYATGTIGAAIRLGLYNVMWALTSAEQAQVLAGGTAIDLTSKIVAAKLLTGNRPLYMPAGTWSFTSIDFKGNTGGIVGDGIGNTILSVRSVVTKALDFADTTDANPRTYTLKDFTLEGNGLGVSVIGIDIRYRHQALKQNIYVRGFTGTGIKELDTYCCTSINVRSAANGLGWHLVGSNHADVFTGCVIDSNTVGNLLIENNGTIPDGNEAILLNACVVQSALGSAYGADITCSSLSLNSTYLGENNAASAAVRVRAGTVRKTGGVVFFGASATTYAHTPTGGRTWYDGTKFNGQTFSGIQMLSGGGTGGKVGFMNITFGGVVSGAPYFVGDVLDYGPQQPVYTKRLGKQWAVQMNNVTTSSVVSGNRQTFTCLTAPGPSPLMGANCALSNTADWRDGEPLYLVLVYESSKPINIRTNTAPFGAGVISFASSLPATSGGIPHTALCLQSVAVASPGSIVEVYQSSTAVNDTLVIHECFLSDSRMAGLVSGQVRNLYKC